MSKSTIDISEASTDLLRDLVEKTGQSPAEVIDKALAAYRREVFFQNMDAGYVALRRDPEAWAEFEADRREWDTPDLGGLGGEEHRGDEGPSSAH